MQNQKLKATKLAVLLALSIAPLSFAQTVYDSHVLASKPLGYWPLAGNPGDMSGNGNNGTLVNGAFFTNVFTSPVEPQALVLNSAKNQGIVMPTAGSSIFNLGALHALTAMAWFKTTRQGTDFMPILVKIDATITGWAIGLDKGGNSSDTGGNVALVFIVSGVPTLVVEGPQVKNDGAWHFFAATYDGSGSASGVRLYIDGLNVITPTVDVDSIGNSSILNSAPLSIGGPIAGVADVGSFEGALSAPAVFGTALTAAQILQLANDAATARALLGQFAFGGGWYSAVYFSNTGPDEVSFPVAFNSDNGTPMNIPSIGGNSKTITLPPGGSAVIEAPNVGSLTQGYVLATLPVGVTGYGVFRQSAPGIADQEAVAPLTVRSGNTVLVFDETNLVTAVAIVNGSNVLTTVSITVSDTNGNVIGTSSVVLQPNNKTAVALRSLPGLSQIVGQKGTARFTVSTGSIAVLGLRFNGSAFTSIPDFRQNFKFIGAN